MTFVDGVVTAVPTAARAAFLEHARKMAAVLREYGALEVVDCWGVDVPPGKLTSFPMAVRCAEDETVCFGWVVWPSREVRDAGWERLMADPRMAKDANPAPFDGARMIYGGFETILKA